ncbi:MAG: hypothetical protein H6672_07365 [Anaerolineaceae bacterium]|nr:hypothetical protein [Anaerolineaceae bacterium]
MDSMDTGPNPIIGKLFTLLPILLIGMIISGNLLFAAAVIFPAWQTHENLAAQVTSAQDTLHTQAASQDEDQQVAILQNQVDSAQAQLDTLAGGFLTTAQANQLLNQVYQYAQESRVEVAALRSQSPAQSGMTVPLYEVWLYRLQVTGDVVDLLNFLVHLRESAVPSVSLNNLSISPSQGTNMLMLDISIYTSVLATGTALAALPEAPIIQVVVPEATPEPETVSGAVYGDGTAFAVLPNVLPTPEATVSATILDTLPVADTACPGAPETLFKVGDIAVVDFNETGALRILARVNAPDPYIETRAQAYDNQQLLILAGPVCGTWNGQNIWYWYVEREGLGSIQGWAAEADLNDRWMCPLSLPECS